MTENIITHGIGLTPGTTHWIVTFGFGSAEGPAITTQPICGTIEVMPRYSGVVQTGCDCDA
jgi:hypothetical protein